MGKDDLLREARLRASDRATGGLKIECGDVEPDATGHYSGTTPYAKRDYTHAGKQKGVFTSAAGGRFRGVLTCSKAAAAAALSLRWAYKLLRRGDDAGWGGSEDRYREGDASHAVGKGVSHRRIPCRDVQPQVSDDLLK